MKTTLMIIWTIVWFFLCYYFFMPTLSFSASSGIYWAVIIYFIVIFGISVIADSYDDWSISTYIGMIGGIGTFAIMLLIWVSAWPVFKDTDYRNLIGKIDSTEFTANIQPVEPDQMLIVDKQIAERIGEKVLGSDPGLGSRAELGDFTLQAVNKKLYWIAPLEHSGYLKWNSFSTEGTPGYVKVSATNQEDYALVTSVDKKEIHIVYQTGAYCSQSLGRHIWSNGYSSQLFSDYTFEVDDNWHPYWTVTLYDTKIGFEGNDATGVLTVDPESGEIKKYSIADAPTWIDRIQPSKFVTTQADDWGYYIHGWNWNGRDVIRANDTVSMVLGHDGRSYYYVGLTSNGKEGSTVGFAMVDTRTKKAHWFKQAGATEGAAKNSAEGKVQNMNYVGSDGITYNINGKATYEFLLKDKAGLMKLIALVSVHDHSIVGIGESRAQAIEDYENQLSNRGNSVSIGTSNMDKVIITSKIERFSPVTMRGLNDYYFTVEKLPRQIFTAGESISDELPLSRVGDMVTFSYVPTNNVQKMNITTFDNLDLGIKKDPSKVRSDKALDSIRTLKLNSESDKVVGSKWDSLSPQQKKKLLKGIK